MERPGSSSQPEQRLSQTSHRRDIVVDVSVICCVPTKMRVSPCCPEDNAAAVAKKAPPACSVCGCMMHWSVCAWTKLSSMRH